MSGLIAIEQPLELVDHRFGFLRRWVFPNTSWLHQRQRYGQPRAVINETEPIPWRSRQTLT